MNLIKKLSDHRLQLKGKEYLPLIIGGMGVDISTSALALVAARLGGVGHISDAMSPYVSDKKFRTTFQAEKRKKFSEFDGQAEKNGVLWAADEVYQATLNHVQGTMQQKRGNGGIFVNIMEKLTMGNPLETLKARINAALDGGIDGVTLSAGLHNGTLSLVADNPRFHDVNFGIIVSSARALKIFLRSAARVNRRPDYIIVEGPLAGGHLGFGEDWREHSLNQIVDEVHAFLKEAELSIPVVPAGGVFTGGDAVEFINRGASAVQVATRFTISQECGLPKLVKQKYLAAEEEDVVVNNTSPTGYYMRMLKSSPSMRANIKPQCEALGYILDKNGNCAYHQAYEAAGVDAAGVHNPVTDKMCICYHFMKHNCYTCGHYVFRLKDTTVKVANGDFYLPPAEHIFNDYVTSTGSEVQLPEIEIESAKSKEPAELSAVG